MRRFLHQSLTIAWAIATIYMLFTGLRLITNAKYPILVVSSESMEPAFYRGDVIILWNRQHEIAVGDIPVVWFRDRPLPMVHRAVKVVHEAQAEHGNSSNRQLILTKGDNNAVDDTSLYPEGRSFVHRDEVVGLVRGYIPYIGRLSLVFKGWS